MTKQERHDQLLATVASLLNAAQLLLADIAPGADPAHHGAAEPNGGGRPGEVAKAVLGYLRGHPDSRRTDIIEAMQELGYSSTATGDNLRVLMSAGLVTQDERGGPYSAAPPE